MCIFMHGSGADEAPFAMNVHIDAICDLGGTWGTGLMVTTSTSGKGLWLAGSCGCPVSALRPLRPVAAFRSPRCAPGRIARRRVGAALRQRLDLGQERLVDPREVEARLALHPFP